MFMIISAVLYLGRCEYTQNREETMICYEYFVNIFPADGTAMNEVTPVTREC